MAVSSRSAQILGQSAPGLKKGAPAQSMWAFNVPYRCTHCKLRFLEELELAEHHRRQHGLKPQSVEKWNPAERSYGSASTGPTSSLMVDYTCFLCCAPTTSWTEISAHISQVHDRSVCRNCGRLFVSEAALQSHRKNMHDPKFDYHPDHATAPAAADSNTPSNAVASTSHSASERRSSSEESSAEVGGKASTSPSAAPAGRQDCSICGRPEQRTAPQASNGVYTCAHCDWTTLSLARLKLHHFEDHDNGEFAKFLQKAGPSSAVEASTSSSAASLAGNSRDVQRDIEEDAGHSATVSDDPAASACSSDDDTILASCPSATDDSDFEDEGEFETDDEVMPQLTKRTKIACRYCAFTCAMASSLRRHHALKHGQMPFIESRERNASRKRHAPPKGRQALRKTRAKDNSKMHGYQRDGFVCSDDTSAESSQEAECEDMDIVGASMAVPSPLSDGDASWHPSELSGEGTQKGDDSFSDTGEDELSSVGCEKCNKTFASKLKLAVHMAKLHRLPYFCFHCGRTMKQVELLRLHHRREHRKLAFKYLTLSGTKLVTVTHDDTGENEEHSADESTCLIGRPAQQSVKHQSQPSSSSSHAEKSSKQRSVSRSPTEHLHSATQRRKKLIICSSSDEEESVHKPEAVRSISRFVYSGYRCPKSVGAFHQLMAKICDEFKCSAFSCGFSTNSASDFEGHLRSHSIVDVFCIYCGVDVDSPGALIAHLGQHHSSLQHQCSMCLYRASKNAHFRVHCRQAHPGDAAAVIPVSGQKDTSTTPPASSSELRAFDPYMCGFSGCSFKDKKQSEFERHFEEVHAEEKSFPCFVCRKGFQSAAGLVRHLQEHGFANVQCGYCNFGTASTGAMMYHACYCHSGQEMVFRVRSENIAEELISYSDKGVRYIPPYDLSHLTFQQRCCFCPEMVSGFNNFQRHVSSEHNFSLSVEELADRLFAAYDYTEAVKVSQCPFCSFAVDNSCELRKHVLRQELGIVIFTCSACHGGFDDQLSFQQHIDRGHCPATATMQECNNGRLLLWTEQNLKFRIHRFLCTHCQENFAAVSNFRSHLLRHYTLYPTECKICGEKFRGIRSKDEHMRTVHGGSGTGQDFASYIDEEVVRQTVSDTVHSCPHCNFKSLSQSYITTHAERCALSGDIMPVQQAEDRVPGTDDLNADAEEEQPRFIYHCMHCSVGFIYLQHLLGHGFARHGCCFFCSRCYKGFKAKSGFVQHCKSRACKQPESMLYVEPTKKGSRTPYFFKETFIVYDKGADGLSGEEQDGEGVEESGAFSFYNRSYEPVKGIERGYLTDSRGAKLSLQDAVRFMNFQVSVNVVDWQKTLF